MGESLTKTLPEIEALVLEAEQLGVTYTSAGFVANIRGRLVRDPGSRFHRPGQEKMLSGGELDLAYHGLQSAIQKHKEAAGGCL